MNRPNQTLKIQFPNSIVHCYLYSDFILTSGRHIHQESSQSNTLRFDNQGCFQDSVVFSRLMLRHPYFVFLLEISVLKSTNGLIQLKPIRKAL
jgi:hypothetical protein